MTGQGRLPVVFPPETDERLFSWLARLASFYAMSVPEFLAEIGFSGLDLFDLEWRFAEGEGALIAARTGISAEAIHAMTFRDMVPEARLMIARKNRHHCPRCPGDIHRKPAALPWVFRCPTDEVDLDDATGTTLSGMLGLERFAALEAHAKLGVAVLDAWARGEGQGALGPVEMLFLLTTRHRRASPPNIAEQPRMTLAARRDYHEFLTTLIVRLALTVIVPEYDHVAPLLAKPVRPGLHALAQGSLLQSFALTVGIGRIAEDPVARAIEVLLASDADGQERVKDVLRAWPLSLRLRVSSAALAAELDERDRQSAEKAARQRQFHKLRYAQSHKYRYRIS